MCVCVLFLLVNYLITGPLVNLKKATFDGLEGAKREKFKTGSGNDHDFVRATINGE